MGSDPRTTPTDRVVWVMSLAWKVLAAVLMAVVIYGLVNSL